MHADAEKSFEAIGTQWHIQLFDANATAKADNVFTEIIQKIAAFEHTYSRFLADSLVSKIAQQAGTYTLPSDSKPLFDLYYDLYCLTAGSFTPLIGKTLVEAGYDQNYSLKPQTISAVPAWNDVLQYQFPYLKVIQPIQLDFGAAGKGYLVDIISQLLRAHGYKKFCVDAGGDMYYANDKLEQLTVGLEHPRNKDQVIGVVHIVNQSICGSAGNRRAWDKYHHIINPQTLTSPRDILAIWVIADSTLLADGLTTCLFFMKSETLRSKYNFEYLILYQDYSIEQSAQFPAELFTQ